MSVQPLIWCYYDRCCQFQPEKHNHRYCTEHKCKRKAENARKRLTDPSVQEDIEEVWTLQENKRLAKVMEAQVKNEWILNKSRILFYDIEASNLDASIGLMICACVKERGGATQTFEALDGKKGIPSDREALLKLRDALEAADFICGYYSMRYDLVFINTRLLMHGERPIQQLRHIDLYYTARYKLKLHSNRLDVVAETLLGHSEKTRVVGPIWTRALMGDREAVGYIIEHCEKDVKVLEDVFEKLKGFVNFAGLRWRSYGAAY